MVFEMGGRLSPRAWLVVALVVATILSGSVILLGSSVRTAANRSQVVQRATADMYQLSALEWEAIAEGRAKAETADAVDRVTERLSASGDMLAAEGVTDDAARSDLKAFVDAVGQELELLDAGQVEAAVEIDEAIVDPLFDDLIETYEEAAAASRRNADRTNLVTSGLLVLVTMAGVVFSSFAVRRTEAARQLERLVKAKDQLIATIAHELRTPLTSLVGFAEILRDEGLTPEDRSELIRIVADEGMDLANIVDDLLVAAKVEAGTLTLTRVRVDLRAQTAQVLERWERGAIGHVEFSGSSVHTMGDPARVRQILRNLVSNALRYGGERVRVVVSGDHALARVMVRDDGGGVSPADRETIFEPYRQAHKAAGLTASMGLGLTISRQLARVMGGDVTYRREAGESVFELALPRAAAESSERADTPRSDALFRAPR